MEPKKEQNGDALKRIAAGLAWLGLVVLFLWGAAGLLQRWQGLQAVRRAYATRTAQYGALVSTRAALADQLTQGITTATVEAWAHSAGWARPGERPVRPLWGQATGTPTPGGVVTPTPTPTVLPPWRMWWGLFFGPASGLSGKP